MRGRSSSPDPLLKHGRSRDDRDGGGDWEREIRHRHRSQSRERSHRHRHRSRSPSRSHSPIDTVQHRGRSRSSSPSRRREDSRSPHGRRKKRHRSRSASTLHSVSDEDSKRRKHHRKHKHRHRRSSRSLERKEKKKARREKRKLQGASTSQWGQHGIINEADLYKKEEEFRAWLIEEKMMNRETMSKDQEKKLFLQFVEDYNTATLPHDKYYNMAKYEAHMSLLRNGELVPPSSEYNPNTDFQAHAASHKRSSVQHETHLTRDQLAALRKVQNERIEVGKMKVLGLEVKNSMGVRMDGNEFEPGRR